jgi:N-acetylglucosaminyl-diphospho-decaprenol L-rhamnosyltransferase
VNYAGQGAAIDSASALGNVAPGSWDVVTVSVVSHGHDRYLPLLLNGLARTGGGAIRRVSLVHNLKPSVLLANGNHSWPFELTETVNHAPLGFGANHNRSFQTVDTPFFCVLNPDIAFAEGTSIWESLVSAAGQPRVGCAYPELRNLDGTRQDNARSVPTPLALVRRRLFHHDELRIDWASAAFWMLKSQAFRELDGFDERYHMYCEDVDFCLRMQLAGWQLRGASDVHAIHDAHRSSHLNMRYLGWHLASLLRLWAGAPLRRFVMKSGSV